MEPKELFDLTGKNALIVGVTGNLGPIWNDTLSEAGATVYGIDEFDFDVSDRFALRRWEGKRDLRNIPTPDIIIYNAGIDNPPGSNASFFGNCQRILEVNLMGAVNVCEVFVPQMIKNGGGDIIFIGSIQGNVAADWRNYPDKFEKPIGYNLSKAGLIQLSRSITVQYGRFGVRAVTLSFGAYDNGRHDPDFQEKFTRNVPIRRMANKSDLQAALLGAVCSRYAAGTQFLHDGGYTAW